MADEIDWDKMTVKGTSTALEKEYFRLTRVPDPATVRPEAVLKQSFQMVKERWKNTEDWDYVCEQMKSIRQDLTVSAHASHNTGVSGTNRCAWCRYKALKTSSLSKCTRHTRDCVWRTATSSNSISASPIWKCCIIWACLAASWSSLHIELCIYCTSGIIQVSTTS